MNARSMAVSIAASVALVTAAFTSSPAPAAAQGTVSLGIGFGTAKNTGLEIAGPHAHAAARAVRLFGDGDVWLRIEAFVQRATGDGSATACRQVEPRYCLGRSDEAWLFSGAASLEMPLDDDGGIDAYLVPIGIGVYRRSVTSVERQGPTTTCVEGDLLVGCGDDPPLATLSDEQAGYGPGGSVGGGFRVDVRGVEAYVEVRIHLVYYGDQVTRAAPIVAGITF